MEFYTRHLLDGRIIDCDPRIETVAGYKSNKVCNLSPFPFIHQDDVYSVIDALNQMYRNDSSYGEAAYRVLTRNGNIIYLQSKAFLEIDKDTNNVHSFCCISSQLNNEEGQIRVQQMKEKFPGINITFSNFFEYPEKLEMAVLDLIWNLQHIVYSNNTDPTRTLVPPETPFAMLSIRQSVAAVKRVKAQDSDNSTA